CASAGPRFDRLHTYEASTWICSLLSRSFCAGITFSLPLLIIAVMASSPQPCSHTLSVRLGAPSAWLPLPSMPWQPAHTANLARPLLAAMLLYGLPDRLST